MRALYISFMRTDRVTADPWDEKMIQKHGGAYATRAAWQEKAITARLEKMAALQGPQLRTLIKKLHFLMSFEKSGGEVAKACAAVGISRKTFYLWLEKDATFQKLIDIKARRSLRQMGHGGVSRIAHIIPSFFANVTSK